MIGLVTNPRVERPEPRTFCLTVHAGYRCRHSGRCCRAAWDIPIEAAAAARLRHADGMAHRIIPVQDAAHPGVAGLAARNANGACAFLEEPSTLCAIHRLHGRDALPASCRLFPRLVLEDRRGTFINLSHFCPTAAASLFEASTCAIVDAPASLSDVGPLQGLDAREQWPPLLRPDVLMDLDAYTRWERLCVETLGAPGMLPARALGLLAGVAEYARAWTPGAGSLIGRLEEAASPTDAGTTAAYGYRDVLVRASVPDRFRAPLPPPDFASRLPASLAMLDAHAPAVGRWLASKAFANWMAYQARGLRTIVEYLRACFDVLVVEAARATDDDRPAMIGAIGRADFLLVHLADSLTLARQLSAVEVEPGVRSQTRRGTRRQAIKA